MRLLVDDISVSLAGTPILADVTASVDPGTLVGLVGPNGAGKTTLLRTITGAIDPTDGRVLLDDTPVHALSSRAASRHIASVPQQPNLDFEFTVREVVEMGRHPHRRRLGGSDAGADVVDHALERAQVVDLADRAVTTLSGGERQRVLLARALAQDAPLLVLDEPTASLDVHHQIRTLGLVRDLVDDGRTAIAAIHDLDLASRYCDDLVLLADGTVQATGTPGEVLTPDRLRAAFGAATVVTRSPVTGTPTITVRDDDPVTAIDAHVHVLGGATHAARYLPGLADAARTLTAGPLVAGGQDHAVAESVDVPHLTIPPHTEPDADATAQVERWLDEADVSVVPPELYGSALADRAAASTLLVEPGPETPADALVDAVAAATDRDRRHVELPAN